MEYQKIDDMRGPAGSAVKEQYKDYHDIKTREKQMAKKDPAEDIREIMERALNKMAEVKCSLSDYVSYLGDCKEQIDEEINGAKECIARSG